MATGKPLRLKSAKHWAPRPAIAPKCRRNGGDYVVTSNGEEGCYGGWDLFYVPPKKAGAWVEAEVSVRWCDLPKGFDNVNAGLYFGKAGGTPWAPMLPKKVTRNRVVYACRAPVPAAAKHATLRLCMAGATRGQLRWSAPRLCAISAPRPRRICLGAGGGTPAGKGSLKRNTDFYLRMAREGADAGIDLLTMPEVILSVCRPWTASLTKMAVSVPGREIEPFQKLAAQRKIALCFSIHESSGKLVHNTAVLINKRGDIVGKYRKVHLAQPGEVWCGTTPGDRFPVFDLHGAKVGMNICMDSSAADSSRCVGRNGAEILCMPIMGDHRATSVVSQGKMGYFDLEWWEMIQRVHALDNQVFLVVSRNGGPGSGIFSLRGETLAMTLGPGITSATVDLNALPQSWTGGTLRGIDQYQRRESVYVPPATGLPLDPFADKE